METLSDCLAARAVLGAFVAGKPDLELVPLGNRGGFSGARLWRIEGDGGPFCLRAWPAAAITPEQLERIHGLMTAARNAKLDFVPQVFATPSLVTWVERAGRLWDLTRWLPGEADFRAQPTLRRLEAACTALAKLHRAWENHPNAVGPCPAVQRRLDRTREWTALVDSGWRPAFTFAEADVIDPQARRAWHLIQGPIRDVPRRLARWTGESFPLQPCLCDVWHDHVLFEGDRVTGIVDFGSVKMDHVAVDLARLLGTLVEDNEEMRAAGIRAYSRIRPLTLDEEKLIWALDETGTLVGAANWLLWIYREGKVFEDCHEVAKRIAALSSRIEKW